ncbi:molybdenum cofactor guanylyltransferase [Arsenicicoccus sp. oral taxon 190]|uniref:molybdenum cofactor guanylyltransferase n=1 Tax=Arsenicicoccus sp. oral taxon 190 TaxID=1658671 RepID=UPI00067CB13F|nr:NTP transferase domain-containing protein [Arsenicicoccus sp. oral taxon 190]
MTGTIQGSGVTAVVLCGGTSVRMGGTDKTSAQLGGTTVLDLLLDHLPQEWTVVCVGTERPTSRPVTWTREDPPLGGPAAGIATGAALSENPVTVVVAGDQPFAGDAAQPLVQALAAAGPGVQAVALIDDTGRLQPLLAAYDTLSLRSTFPPGTSDVSVHRTVATLRMDGITPPSTHVLLDVDTPQDLDAARAYHLG